MRISELPQEVKEKALDYQKNEKYYNTFDNNSDILSNAFNWRNTFEGYEYWFDWDRKKNFKETYINPYVKNKYDSNGVTKPIQYQIGIDTFQRSESNLTKEEIIAICKFNIDKYCWRKKDQDKDDFKKIIDYANWAIKNL
jgi:hypothetical protein